MGRLLSQDEIDKVFRNLKDQDDGSSQKAASYDFRRPDRIANGNLAGDQRSLSHWFDTTAFTLAVGHYGNSGRDILTANLSDSRTVIERCAGTRGLGKCR